MMMLGAPPASFINATRVPEGAKTSCSSWGWLLKLSCEETVGQVNIRTAGAFVGPSSVSVYEAMVPFGEKAGCITRPSPQQAPPLAITSVKAWSDSLYEPMYQ